MTRPRIFPSLFIGPILFLFLVAVPLLAAGPAEPASRTSGSALVATGTDAVTGDIHDIKGPIEIPANHLPLILAISAGVFLLVGGTLLYLRRRRSGRSVPAPDVHQQALARLAQAEALMASSQADEFAGHLADILRSYIEARFNLSARNRTSREFVKALAHDPGLPPLLHENSDRLREWLHLCDMAKFARSSLSQEQMRFMLEAVRDFINQTSPEDNPSCATTARLQQSSHNREEIPQ